MPPTLPQDLLFFFGALFGDFFGVQQQQTALHNEQAEVAILQLNQPNTSRKPNHNLFTVGFVYGFDCWLFPALRSLAKRPGSQVGPQDLDLQNGKKSLLNPQQGHLVEVVAAGRTTARQPAGGR